MPWIARKERGWPRCLPRSSSVCCVVPRGAQLRPRCVLHVLVSRQYVGRPQWSTRGHASLPNYPTWQKKRDCPTMPRCPRRHGQPPGARPGTTQCPCPRTRLRRATTSGPRNSPTVGAHLSSAAEGKKDRRGRPYSAQQQRTWRPPEIISDVDAVVRDRHRSTTVARLEPDRLYDGENFLSANSERWGSGNSSRQRT